MSIAFQATKSGLANSNQKKLFYQGAVAIMEQFTIKCV